MLTTESLSHALAPLVVRYYAHTGSTNDLARDLLTRGEPGDVLVTDEQMQGRGRFSRDWYAPPGQALLLTRVIRTDDLQLAGAMFRIGALAVCDLALALGVRDADVRIKWANDVRVSGRKVSGVLPEAVWQGGRLLGVALGVGVNISIDFSVTPFAETATSLSTVLGAPVDRLAALTTLVRHIDSRTAQAQHDAAALHTTWRARLDTLGSQVRLTVGTHTLTGSAEDVDADGALLVRDAAGTLHTVRAGDLMITG